MSVEFGEKTNVGQSETAGAKGAPSYAAEDKNGRSDGVLPTADFYIGGVRLKSRVLAAPLAGFSDAGFRKIAAEYGAGMTYTEMVSAKGLCYNNKGTELLLQRSENEMPCAVQIFGSEPEFMYKAAKDERLAAFDVIDINMGCPVKKIFGNGEGSALMLDPSLITEIVSAVKEGAKRPVTVKMRSGVREGEVLAVECALAAERGGADAICVHPRVREQFYSGRADHEVTRLVKESVGIPVIANGDICNAADMNNVLALTCADAVMIGRAALGRQSIFSELNGIKREFSPRQAALEHIAVLRGFMPDKTVVNAMKLHLCHYAKGTEYSKAVRSSLATTLDMPDVFAIIEKYFK